MADNLSPALLLFLTTLTLINPQLSSAKLSTARSFPPEKPPTQEQLGNIITALIGTGDFLNWANVLSLTDPSTFPLTATLFIPSDDAFSSLALQIDPSIFPYHVVPQKLNFSDLQRFKIGSRLPTLLHNKSILVTNNSRSNFTVDGSRITYPDLYINGAVSVHGIGFLLNYSAYGGAFREGQMPGNRPNAPNSSGVFMPHLPAPGNSMGRRRSDAPCLCTEFSIILSIVSTVLALKIYRNPSIR